VAILVSHALHRLASALLRMLEKDTSKYTILVAVLDLTFAMKTSWAADAMSIPQH
jgi:hypothetical protein